MLDCKCLSQAVFGNSMIKSIINIIVIIWFLSLIITVFEKIDAQDNKYLVLTFLMMFILYNCRISGIVKTYNECKLSKG